MPFPLAHPAAVLPLRRFCPRYFSLPALVIGSLSTDVGYCFERTSEFSHHWVGSVAFCLPVGIGMLALFYGLCSYASHLPESKTAFVLGWALGANAGSAALPGREEPGEYRAAGRIGWGLVMVVSILIGAWTHLLWDAFTNKQGWAVLHVAVLRAPIGTVAGHQVQMCHLLWYACSFAGVAWVWLACQQSAAAQATFPVWNKAALCKAALVGILVLPIGIVHHLVQGWPGLLLVAMLSTVLVVVGMRSVEPRGVAS